jgi:hypothetical protein
MGGRRRTFPPHPALAPHGGRGIKFSTSPLYHFGPLQLGHLISGIAETA